MSIQTSNLEAAKIVVEWHPTVKNATVLDRHPDACRMLEIVLLPEVDRVPPGVLESLADNDCGISGVQSQGNYLIVEVK